MTSKQALKIIRDELKYVIDDLDTYDRNVDNAYKQIKKDLQILEKLKDPYEEEISDDGTYQRISHYYWNEELNELNCATSIQKWDGTYVELKPKLVNARPIKTKNYVEVFHCGTGYKPVKLAEYLKIEKEMNEIIEEKENGTNKQ